MSMSSSHKVYIPVVLCGTVMLIEQDHDHSLKVKKVHKLECREYISCE